MTYLNNTRKKSKKVFYITIFIVLMVIIINVFNIKFISDSFRWMSYPILKTKEVVLKPFSGSIGYFKTKKALENKNDELLKQINDLNNSLLQSRIIEVENENLRNMLGRQDEEKQKIVGFVLSRPPFSPYDTFILDIGSGAVAVGDKVYGENVYLGEIVEVNQNTSIVRLVSSADIKTEVLIDGKIQGEAIGMGGGTLSIRLPKGENINVGSVVSVPTVLRGIIGVVQEIQSEETSTFTTAFLNLPIGLNKISVVTVVKP